MSTKLPAGKTSGISVRPIRPDDWKTIAKLFGTNGACGGCWCMYWRLPRGGRLWEENKGARNKRAFQRLIATGNVFGCLAFVEEEPVGWCCVGPRSDFPRIERTKALATDWDDRTWAVTCFYIPSRWRHRGVATKLLRAAVALAREWGAKELEGYPVRPKPDGTDMPAAFAWTGVPRLFQKQGFRDVTPDGNARPLCVRRFRSARSDRQLTSGRRKA